MKLYIIDNDPRKVYVSRQEFEELLDRVSNLENNNNQGDMETGFTQEWKNKINSIARTRIVNKGSSAPSSPLNGDLWWNDEEDKLQVYNNGWEDNTNDSNIGNYLYVSNEDDTLYKYVNSSMTPIGGGNSLEDSDNVFEIKDEHDNSIFQIVEGHIVTLNFDSRKLKKEVKVLSIGDKRTIEAFAYVPKLLENMGMDVTFGILYSDNYTLPDLDNYLTEDTNIDGNDNPIFTDLYTYTTEKGNWINETVPVSSDNLMTYTDWDIVVLQNYSNVTTDLSSNILDLDDIISDISLKSSKGIKIGWLIETPDVSDNTPAITTISNVLDDIFYEHAIEFIIPCGTAITIMRTKYPSIASELGDNGDLTYESTFLQDGLPRLIEAYTAASTIATIYGHEEKGIIGDDFIPNKDWILNSNIPLQQGNPVGLERENCIIGQMCAVKAIKAYSSSAAAESLFPNNN